MSAPDKDAYTNRHETASCPPPVGLVIALSGNVAVGKSTLGERLADRLGAVWISETSLSSQFAHLISQDNAVSRLLAEITFASLRTSVVLSHIYAGCKKLVVERSLWEDWLFFDMWRERFNFHTYDAFMDTLFDFLRSQSSAFRLRTIMLTADVSALAGRVRLRNKPYDHLFSKSVIAELQRRYDAARRTHASDIAMTFDISHVNLANSTEVEALLSEMVNALTEDTTT